MTKGEIHRVSAKAVKYRREQGSIVTYVLVLYLTVHLCKRPTLSRIQPLSHATKSFGRASSPCTGEPRTRSDTSPHTYTSAHRTAARYLSLSLFAPLCGAKIQLPPQREPRALPRRAQSGFALRLPTVRRTRILSVICRRKATANASSPCTGEPRTRSDTSPHTYTSAHRTAARYLSLSLFAPLCGVKIQLPPQREPRRLPPHAIDSAAVGAKTALRQLAAYFARSVQKEQLPVGSCSFSLFFAEFSLCSPKNHCFSFTIKIGKGGSFLRLRKSHFITA